MMRLNKPLADLAIALLKIEIAGLTYRAVEFLSVLRCRAIALNFSVINVLRVSTIEVAGGMLNSSETSD